MADNEEKLILTADASGLDRTVTQAAKVLRQLTDTSSLTDKEITKLESSAAQLAIKLDKLGSSGSNSARGVRKLTDESATAVAALRSLEKAQRGVSDAALANIQLPKSLQGRNAAGQFTQKGVEGLSDKDLAAINNAYAAMQETLSSKARAESKRRQDIFKEELAASAALAKAEAERQAQTTANRYTPGANTKAVGNLVSTLTPAQQNAMAAAAARTTTAFQANSRVMAENTRVANENARGTTVMTKAQSEAADAVNRASNSLASTRYALYDVASTYGVISAAMIAASIAAVKVGADFETAFSSVERTLDGNPSIAGIAGIRKELVDLSTQIPKTFAEVSEIATLGNQLGVAQEDLTEFTTVVTQSSVAFGVSADSIALSFGKIGNLVGLQADQYGALGSSIALAGRRSAATEQQIISVAEQIAAVADDAGFSAKQIIGLSTALASLKVPPEQSRGSLSIYFNAINSAVASGGKELQNFATITGLTVDQITQLARSGEGGEKIFRAFIEGLNQTDSVGITTALDELGLSQVRVDNTFRRLASGTKIYDDAQRDAAQGFDEGTELARQYAIVVDDLNSQWMIFTNSVNALIASLSGGAVSGLAGLLGAMTNIVNKAREFTDNPVARNVTAIILVLSSAIGVYLAYRVAMALTAAATIALAQTQGVLAGHSGFGIVANLLKTLTPALYTYVTALKVTAATSLTTGRAAVVAGANMVRGSGGVATFTASLVAARVAALNLLAALGPLAIAMKTEMDTKGLKNLARFDGSAFTGAQDAINNVTGSLVKTGKAGTAAGKSASLGIGNIGKSAGSAAKQVRTLVDYASDLRSTMQRAFDIRYKAQLDMDDVTSTWSDLRDRIRDANNELLKLNADKAMKEDFLSVANQYGNILQSGNLTADIEELNAKIADTQANASKELKGNSKAAIQNRKTITGLVSGYEDYIESLAASGASQATINAAIAKSKAEFIAQATALGYSNTQLKPYIASFRDMAVVLANMPRNVTVNANFDPAKQALAEYIARVRSSAASPTIGNASAARAAGTRDGNAYGNGFSSSAGSAAAAAAKAVAKAAADAAAKIIGRASGGGGGGGSTGGYANGGYTGPGGKYEPKGVVHGGEFVFDKKATTNAGVQNLYALQAQMRSGRRYASGGYVGTTRAIQSSGMSIVELGPKSLGVLREAVSREVAVYLGDVDVARSAARGNKQLQGTGSN